MEFSSVHGRNAAFWMFVAWVWCGGFAIGSQYVSLITVSWYPLDPPPQTISLEVKP